MKSIADRIKERLEKFTELLESAFANITVNASGDPQPDTEIEAMLNRIKDVQLATARQKHENEILEAKIERVGAQIEDLKRWIERAKAEIEVRKSRGT